jgi:hypothetical protein
MRFLAVIFTVALCAGCATAPLDLETGDHAITNGTPEAIGVLDLLNDPTTDITLLDKDAGLNVRSARNLMLHRNGWDGIIGTYDDNLYGDIEEVDSIRWVGPTAIAQLVDFAAASGFIPAGEDILGTWDNVTFTVLEADAVIAFINEADHSLLDDEVGLDRRAANSIIAAQPVATVDELAGLYFVGTTALEALIEIAVVPVEITSDDFVADVASYLADYYADLGADIANLGGNSLDDAQLGLDCDLVEILMDPADDPHGHDFESVVVLSHPDVVFDEGDAFWYAAYDLVTGALVEVYSFE